MGKTYKESKYSNKEYEDKRKNRKHSRMKPYKRTKVRDE